MFARDAWAQRTDSAYSPLWPAPRGRQVAAAHVPPYAGTVALATVRPFAGDHRDRTARWFPGQFAPERPIAAKDLKRDALATAMCLMEGYGRFLFSDQASAEARGIDPEEVSRALNTVHPGTDLVGRIIARLRANTPYARALDWYRWITTSPMDAQDTDAVSRLFSMAPGSYGDGRASPADTRFLLDALAHSGLCVVGAPLSTRATTPPANLQPLFYFKGAAGRLMLANEVLGIAPDRLARWIRGDQREATELASADRALRAFFDRGVRRYAPRDCARHLLPDFTRLFGVRFCLVPIAGDVVLMGAIESPIVESLLAVDPTNAIIPF
nr:hypothetical protein [Pandoravirus massiliensis]